MREEDQGANCLTCYGTGETVTEQGPIACTDCFGEGLALGRGARLEWRLREIDGAHRGTGSDVEADVLWLIHELRRSREALVLILTLAQEGNESDPIVRDIKYQTNEALGLYRRISPNAPNAPNALGLADLVEDAVPRPPTKDPLA